ncbi:MAG: hypothetical protein ACRD5Z_18450, partial [Bryobacteraceae bacterium]
QCRAPDSCDRRDEEQHVDTVQNQAPWSFAGTNYTAPMSTTNTANSQKQRWKKMCGGASRLTPVVMSLGS